MNKNKAAHGLRCQIKHDLAGGCLQGWQKILPFFIMVLALSLYEAMSYRQTHEGLLSISDLMLNMFCGMRIFYPFMQQSFEIPVEWLFMQVYVAFAIGNYAAKDMSGYGQQFLLRATKKSYWFLGKSVYCLVTVLEYYLLAYGAIALGACIGGRLSFAFTTEYYTQLLWVLDGALTPWLFVLHIVLLPILTSLAVSLLQTMLMLYIKPLISFCCVVAYMGLSAYQFTYALIGNYSMVLRSNVCEEGGLNGLYALGILLALIVAVVAAGCRLLKKCDFIEKV